MIQVTKEVFQEFIKNYPRTLEVNYCAISEPATISYNDFTLGNWPTSIVAKTFDSVGPSYFIIDL